MGALKLKEDSLFTCRDAAFANGEAANVASVCTLETT